MNVGRRLAAPAAAFLLLLATAPLALAQTTWPQEIADPEGTIVVYQPQPETLKGNVLTGRAAMSFKLTGQDRPHLRRVLVHVDDRLRRGQRDDDAARHQGHEGALARVEAGRRGALHEGGGDGRGPHHAQRLDRASLGEPGERGARAEEPRRAQERPAEDRLLEPARRAAPLRRPTEVERRREEPVRARAQHAVPGRARHAFARPAT